MTVKNIYKLSALLMLAVAISGCGTIVKSNITVFHKLPQQNKVVEYAFVPYSYQKNSLEYATYMGYIKQELAKHNYALVPRSQASVYVKLDYAIGNGKVKTESIPTYGKTGVSGSTTYATDNSYGTLNNYGSYGTYNGTSSSTSRTTYTPTYGVTGSRSYSVTHYTRKVKLQMINKKTNQSVYEAKITSEGRSGQIGSVMPYMIKALFKDFPGKSGSTKQVSIPMK